jgi:hypothetical protein
VAICAPHQFGRKAIRAHAPPAHVDLRRKNTSLWDISEEVGDNSVINLGSGLGPNIDLTIEDDGVFAVGGAVPESSTWAMMLLGFAGLGFMGWRSQRSRVPATI